MTFVFDCESGPLPGAGEFLEPFEPVSTWKDPEKIEAARLKHVQKELGRAALDPLTGQILTITVHAEGQLPHGFDIAVLENLDPTTPEGEKVVIQTFWSFVNVDPLSTVVGFCSNSFDLPMLFARSWAHGLKPPPHLRRGRYFSDYAIDLQEVWLCGRKKTEGVSLDRVCRAVGLPGKSQNGVTGANFAEMYATDRKKAIEYAANDLEITVGLYKHLCQ